MERSLDDAVKQNILEDFAAFEEIALGTEQEQAKNNRGGSVRSAHCSLFLTLNEEYIIQLGYSSLLSLV